MYKDGSIDIRQKMAVIIQDTIHLSESFSNKDLRQNLKLQDVKNKLKAGQEKRN
jgi:hypothetical protein